MGNFMLRTREILNIILSRIVSFLLIIMTLLVLYQVFTRYAIGKPSDFTEEIVRYSLVWTGFLGAAYAFGTRQHMSLVFFRDKLDIKAKCGLSIAINVVILLFAAFVMVWGGLQLSFSTMKALSALLGIPRGLVYMIGPISGVFIIIGQIINIWEDYNEAQQKLDGKVGK